MFISFLNQLQKWFLLIVLQVPLISLLFFNFFRLNRIFLSILHQILTIQKWNLIIIFLSIFRKQFVNFQFLFNHSAQKFQSLFVFIIHVLMNLWYFTSLLNKHFMIEEFKKWNSVLRIWLKESSYQILTFFTYVDIIRKFKILRLLLYISN